MSVRPERATNRAGCSVACLERFLWELGFKPRSWARGLGLLPGEAETAKEARNRKRAMRKTPRLSAFRGAS